MPKRASGTGDLKQVPLNLRTTSALREKLEERARRSGRSLTQEVERLIERADDIERDHAQFFGSPHSAVLVRLLMSAVAKIERQAGTSWQKSAEATNSVSKAFEVILRGLSRGKALASANVAGAEIARAAEEDEIAKRHRTKFESGKIDALQHLMTAPLSEGGSAAGVFAGYEVLAVEEIGPNLMEIAKALQTAFTRAREFENERQKIREEVEADISTGRLVVGPDLRSFVSASLVTSDNQTSRK